LFGAMVPTLAVGTLLGLGIPPSGGAWRQLYVAVAPLLRGVAPLTAIP
jgi:hypothetical protein